MSSGIGKAVIAVTGVALAAVAVQPMAQAKSPAPVIEVVTLQLKGGVTTAQFDQVDRDVEQTYIRKRPGFLSRESAPGADRSWLVVVHWRSAADAEVSMKSFASAPAAADFMSMIVPDSMVMTRYSR